jgi:hypothetical protein
MGIRTIYCYACGVETYGEIKHWTHDDYDDYDNYDSDDSDCSEKTIFNDFNNYVNTLPDTKWLEEKVIVDKEGNMYDCVSNDNGYGDIKTTNGEYEVLYHVNNEKKHGILFHKSCYNSIKEYNGHMNIYHLYKQLLQSTKYEKTELFKNTYGKHIINTWAQFPNYYEYDDVACFNAILSPGYFANPSVDGIDNKKNKKRIIRIFERMLHNFGDKVVYLGG